MFHAVTIEQLKSEKNYKLKHKRLRYRHSAPTDNIVGGRAFTRYASQNEILVLGSQDKINPVVLGTGLFHLTHCEMVVGSRC